VNRPIFLTALWTEKAAVRVGAPRAHAIRFGIGQKAASAALRREDVRKPGALVVLVGFSGALSDALRPGDLVVATSLSSVGDDEMFPIASADRVVELLSGAGLEVSASPLVTAPRIVSGREAREKAASGGAVAVDLESRWFAPLASTGNLVVVRAIVDVPGKEIRSVSTPVAALRAGRSIARATRVIDQEIVNFDIRTQKEQVGEP